MRALSLSVHTPCGTPMCLPRRRLSFIVTALLTILLTGCPPGGGNTGKPGETRTKVLLLNASDPIATVAVAAPASLAAAKNEIMSFSIVVSDLPAPREKVAPVLRMHPLRMGAG